jgi:DUF917 family protein
MSRILHKRDFIEMCWGAVLRSDGGDYPLEVAVEEIERIDAEEPEPIAIEQVTVDEMEDGKYAVAVGKLGPVSTDAESCHSASGGVLALEKMRDLASMEGKEIGYLAHLEHDCIQIPYFLKVARECGLKLLDADACGRSVPTLGNILPIAYGKPISPFVYAGANNETIVIQTEDPSDYETCELIGRNVVMGYGNTLISYCMQPWSKQECMECLVAGSPSSQQATGRALMKAKDAGADAAEAALNTFDGELICRGKVKALELECRDGFDFGVHVIAGDDGNTYRLLVQNEVLACEDENGNLILTAPDSIGMISIARGQGITNAELEVGMELEVVGIRAAEPWYRNPDALKCWEPVFESIGLNGVKHVRF